MKKQFILALSALAFSGTAEAAPVYSNNFDTENGGATALNYRAYAGLGVSFGTTDLYRSGELLGVTCVGGSGSCVDLDGARVTSTAVLNFLAGDVITLTFDVSGNQRIPMSSDNIGAGFIFGARTTMLDYTRLEGTDSFNFGTVVIDPATSDGSIQTSYSDLPNDAPFAMRGLRFTAGNAGSLRFFIQNVELGITTRDGAGPVIDNVGLDRTAAAVAPAGVPEPATWAMMVLGFGGVGYAMRRKQKGGTRVRYA